MGRRPRPYQPLLDRLLHGRPADVPDRDHRARPRRRHWLLRLADGAHRTGSPAPAEVAAQFESPVLAIWAGADRGITPSIVTEFEEALERAGVEHRSITYPDAPHSFFDRTATEHAEASAAAWGETLAFIRARTA